MRALVVALVLLCGATAEAREREREGLVVGIGLGPGGLGGDLAGQAERDGGVALEARLGGIVHPRVALLAGFSAVGTGDASPQQTVLSVLARVFITEVFWVEAGLGASTYTDEPDVEQGGTAVLGAVGVDVFRTKKFALGVGLHTGWAWYDADRATGTSALTLLLTWY